MDDQEFADAVAALDVAVVPYPALNSGWLHVCLTFGLPVITPASPSAEEVVPRAARLTYAPVASSPDITEANLARQLPRATELTTPVASTAARSAVACKSPEQMSERFVAGVLERATSDRWPAPIDPLASQ